MRKSSEYKPNQSYLYGLIILSILCFLAAIVSIKIDTINPFNAGLIFIGLFLMIQYLKTIKSISKQLIKLLTWVVLFGFLIVDILLIVLYYR